MAFKIVLWALVAFSILACTPKEKKYPQPEEVPGSYLNTYSADVINPKTGEVIGNRTVNDTIIIKPEGDYFRVSNRKWLRNDYDGNGWVDSMQGERKPTATYDAEYFRETGLLRSLIEDSTPPLFLERKKIYWGKLRALEYSKVKHEPK